MARHKFLTKQQWTAGVVTNHNSLNTRTAVRELQTPDSMVDNRLLSKYNTADNKIQLSTDN